MAERVVQDSDEDDLESPALSPKGLHCTFGNNYQSWVHKSYDTSSGKIRFVSAY